MTAISPDMKVMALNQWYGSARLVAERIGAELAGSAWVGIGCGGGCCEIPFIDARNILVCDLHRHMINLARVIRDPVMRELLKEHLRLTLFHPDELASAQRRCRERESLWSAAGGGLFGAPGTLAVPDDADREPDLQWAIDYFICSWMGQGGRAGTADEFDGCLSVRFDAGGGGSARRFRSMIDSLDAWGAETERCDFVVRDVFEFLAGCQDKSGLAIYLDPPWADAGLLYKFPFTTAQHERLARDVARFDGIKGTRVVLRYGDHPLIRRLYSDARWTIIERVGRDQNNVEKPEVLIINGPSYARRGEAA